MTLAKQVAEIEEKLRIGRELPYEIIGIRKAQVMLIAGIGRRLFDARRFEDAADIFFMLTVLDPDHYQYWVSLGMCEQNMENYEAAVIAYYTATCLGHRKAQVYFHCAQCMWSLEEYDAALSFLASMRLAGSPTPSTQDLWDAADDLERMIKSKVG
jgi:tetratricopeptide (TPR) repeat protein